MFDLRCRSFSKEALLPPPQHWRTFTINHHANEKLVFRGIRKSCNDTFAVRTVFSGGLQLITILGQRLGDPGPNDAAARLLAQPDPLIRLQVNAPFSKGQAVFLHLSSHKRTPDETQIGAFRQPV